MQASPVVEPTPWGTGTAVAAISAGLCAAGVYAFGRALADVGVWLAMLVNIVAAAGTAPTLWSRRRTPVLRWVVYGVTAGAGLGWLALLTG
jgi:hypothetical protein